MKHFFWLSVAAYVFLYFYAAWLYEGFSMTMAISFFVMVCGFFYWRHNRKLKREAETATQPEALSQPHVDTRPLSLWRSPLPYIGIAAIAVIVVGTRL